MSVSMDHCAALQEVLVPYNQDMRVDKNVRLRVFCRDKAPGEAGSKGEWVCIGKTLVCSSVCSGRDLGEGPL